MNGLFDRILVTGISGFVGQALGTALNDKGFTVKGVVRLISANIPDFIEQHEIVNINSATNWQDALQNIDVVIHLAARVHVMHDSVKNPLLEFCNVNTDATLNLARQAAGAGVKRFIYLSTIKVNGEFTLPNNPFKENDVFEPTDPYALSKYKAEQELLRLAEDTQMEVVIIRPPLVYGPGVKANFLSMMRWIYRGIPLPFGSIDNKRSLVSLDNLTSLISTCVDHPAAVNEVFLVSDDEDLSTTELLNEVAHALGKKARLLPVNQKILEFSLKLIGKKYLAQRLCSSLQVDISKAKNLLNWSPPVSVDEALNETAKHFLEHQS